MAWLLSVNPTVGRDSWSRIGVDERSCGYPLFLEPPTPADAAGDLPGAGRAPVGKSIDHGEQR